MNPLLEAFLTATTKPIEFLGAASPEAAARTKVPVEAWIEQARRLALTAPEALRRQLLALQDEFRALGSAAPAERPARARRCRTLLERLREPPPAAPLTYKRTSAGVEKQIEALAQSVQFVKGVGPRRAELFRKFGLPRIEDLLYHLPFRYEDRRSISRIRDLKIGLEQTVVGELIHLEERFAGRTRRRLLEGAVRDDSGILPLTWYNQSSYFRSRYQIGQQYIVHGKVESSLGSSRRIVHPDMDAVGGADVRGIVPVYTKPTAVNVTAMRALVNRAVAEWADRVPSVLPQEVAAAAGLMDLSQALRAVHMPSVDTDVRALNDFSSAAHRSLVFDELFFLQLGLLLRRRETAAEQGIALVRTGTLTDKLRQHLPYRLTAAQERVLAEVWSDMARAEPMHRLIQGDVGSGKTIVAFLAALAAIEAGYQVAVMAPTELLAEQHYGNMQALGTELGVEVEMLANATPRARRTAILAGLRSGTLRLIVGTQALIQEGVEFKALGLGIIDEQHRFGVLQRAALRRHGTPDILLMTATPIPRTLALTLYADLDLSFLDEMPPGRPPIRTTVYHENRRQQVYDLVRAELDKGRQGYVVYPLVEGSDDPSLRDATTMARELARTVFTDYRVGLVHGRMKADEKDAVMRRFKNGDLQLLVSTTVVEVGIDVPNATVIVIEHAERFGLAQLHQLRGRVGRGTEPSQCLLVAAYAQGDSARERLEAMATSSDGFRIAEIDLQMRGPGDFLGTRQAGLPDFRVANLIRDSRVMEETRRAAADWLGRDPALSGEEGKLVRTVLLHRWANRLELAKTG